MWNLVLMINTPRFANQLKIPLRKTELLDLDNIINVINIQLIDLWYRFCSYLLFMYIYVLLMLL